MNKKPTKKDKKRLLDLMHDLDWIFSISGHHRFLRYMDDDKDEDGYVNCDITIEEDYHRITIRIYPHFWKQSLELQRKSILHEYVHFLIEPIHGVAQRLLDGKLETQEHKRIAWEKTVSSVTFMLDMFLKDQYKFGKKSYSKYLK